ncbi:dihydroorotase family protein [Promethearchaeum syntrophicum]|uniref:Dihydroorotase family protein n=1 Tax=Promethearchaeum syntrophicum TaxID=2594042 RepID=A0A5B9D8U2_9ARCH|nr:dihydroorotase family protein [Candidatus Prometheoarchaeum syntrophicum]QEE15688.1 dihydroorotase [Candidatus Prometheoarchaeum syntrophicum]
MSETYIDSRLIFNANIFTNGHVQFGYILIKKGIISKIGEGSPPKALFNEIKDHFDCNEAYVLPGFIDTHVHLRDLKQSYKETLETGSKAAISGGFTTVLTMPNTIPPLSTVENIKKYFDQKRSLYCNVGVFTGVKEGFNIDHLEKISKEGVFGIKIYPGDKSQELPLKWIDGWKNDLEPEEFFGFIEKVLNNFQNEYTHWEKLFEFAVKLKLPILFHPEFPRAPQVLEFFYEQGKKIASLEGKLNPYLYAHHVSHPIYQNEIANIEMITIFLRKFYPNPKNAPHVHFVHVSNSDAITIINTALRQEGYSCSIEISPHHMLLNYDMKFPSETFAKVLVPLRDQKNQQKLFKDVQKNLIDTIGSDHAPHSLEEKSGKFGEAPSGFPNLDFAAQIILTQFFNNKLKLEQVISYLSTQPAKIFNISNKGRIKEGFDADLVVINKVKPYLIKGENAQGMQKWTPWENFELKSKIIKVFLSGIEVYDSKLGFHEAKGKFLKRSIGL